MNNARMALGLTIKTEPAATEPPTPPSNPVHAIAIADILRCPRCRSGLSIGEEYRCANPRCSLNRQAFLFTRGQPVLVDFAKSIVRAVDLENSPAPARPKWREALAKFATTKNHVSERILADIRHRLLSAGGRPRLLIVGGGAIGQGLEQLYETAEIEVIATDIYASDVTTLVADGHQLPFAEESMDAVVIQAVLEHVLAPHQVVAEIHRVMKPHALVFADTPFIQQVHGSAYDFMRFTVSGHRWLFKNFTIIEAGASLGAGAALIWSMRYFIRALTGSWKLGTAFALLFFWLRFLDSNSRNQQDAASGVYFFGTKSIQTIKPTDMIAFYEQQARAG
jgi:SAM-dependent methyltransferase